MEFIELVPFAKTQDDSNKLCIDLKIKYGVFFEFKNKKLLVSYQISDPNVKISDLYPLNANKKTYDQSFLKNELWKTTCFEFFVKKQHQENYFEFNANSLGNWNLYRFSFYRSPLKNETRVKEITLSTTTNSKGVLDYEIDFSPLFINEDSLLFSFSSVLKIENSITYWSNKHSGEKPDFHDANNFTISALFK